MDRTRRTDAPSDLVRVGVAAAIVARTPRTLIRWAARGLLREYRDGNGVRHYSRAALLALAPRDDRAIPCGGCGRRLGPSDMPGGSTHDRELLCRGCADALDGARGPGRIQ